MKAAVFIAPVTAGTVGNCRRSWRWPPFFSLFRPLPTNCTGLP